MKSIRRSHIVVVADSNHRHDLTARLRRMDVAQVTAVKDLEEARRLCRVGNADACLVAIDLTVPDDRLTAESDAPGLFRGIPALIVAPVVTPHLRRMARRWGYRAAVPAAIPPVRLGSISITNFAYSVGVTSTLKRARRSRKRKCSGGR